MDLNKLKNFIAEKVEQAVDKDEEDEDFEKFTGKKSLIQGITDPSIFYQTAAEDTMAEIEQSFLDPPPHNKLSMALGGVSFVLLLVSLSFSYFPGMIPLDGQTKRGIIYAATILSLMFQVLEFKRYGWRLLWPFNFIHVMSKLIPTIWAIRKIMKSI